MQREQFLITSTDGCGKPLHNVIKQKWNSARKEVQSLMQEYANANGGRYTLESTSEKQGFHFVSGVMTYSEAATGKEISFFITKIS